MATTNDYKIVVIISEGNRFNVLNEPHQTEGMPSKELYVPEINAEEISKFYKMQLGSWHSEKIANLSNPESITKLKTLEIDWVTPLDVKAFRQGKIKISPLAACGIVITGDNYVLINLRGGELTEEGRKLFARGYFGLPSSGSVMWKPSYEKDPITDTVVHEFKEEIGNFGNTPGKVIGVVESIGLLPGLKFVSTIKTDATFAQIDGVNKASNEVRSGLVGKGAKDNEIKNELESRALPIDAWESEMLIPITNNRRTIEYLVNAQKPSFVGAASGGLMLYAQT